MGVKKNLPKSIVTPKSSLILLGCILITGGIIFATVKWFESDTKAEEKKSNTSTTAEDLKKDSPKDKTLEEVKLEDKSKEKEPASDTKDQPSKDGDAEENKVPEISNKGTGEEVLKKNKKEEQLTTNSIVNYFSKIFDQLKK